MEEGIGLKDEINTKKEELNHQLRNGIDEKALIKSRELDDLIVKYMLENEEKLK